MAEAGSHSGRRRCPSCRRHLGRFALRCYNCNWAVKNRSFYHLGVAVLVGLIGAGIFLAIQPRTSGGMNVQTAKKVK